jgi:hypothetical protein
MLDDTRADRSSAECAMGWLRRLGLMLPVVLAATALPASAHLASRPLAFEANRGQPGRRLALGHRDRRGRERVRRGDDDVERLPDDAEFDDPFIYWPTPGAAAGQLPLLVPADLPAGWYELRWLSPAPGSSLPVPIARSEPIRIDGSIEPPPPPESRVTTSTSTTTSTTSTTEAPCATARCVLDAALSGAMCAREHVPPVITSRIQHAEDLIDASGHAQLHDDLALDLAAQHVLMLELDRILAELVQLLQVPR